MSSTTNSETQSETQLITHTPTHHNTPPNDPSDITITATKKLKRKTKKQRKKPSQEYQHQIIIAFVNGRSGGQMGAKVMEKLIVLLGEDCVFDLGEGGPMAGLEMYREYVHDGLKVLCCGGDGTICWVLSVLDSLGWEVWPSIAILPLGTGNDLSNVLCWGRGYAGKELGSLVSCIQDSNTIIEMDRWYLNFHVDDEVESPGDFVVNNYFGIGIGSKICLDFHMKREANPELFTSQFVNLGWYGAYGVKGIFTKYKALKKKMKLWVDDEEVEIPKGVQTLVLLNIPSYSGGVDLWGGLSKQEREIFTRQSICDGIIEVVGMKDGLHLGTIQAGVSHGIKIRQGSQVVIECWENEYAQVDGEPFPIPPCRIEFGHKNKANMLFNRIKDTKGKKLLKIMGEYDEMEEENQNRIKDSLNLDSSISETRRRSSLSISSRRNRGALSEESLESSSED